MDLLRAVVAARVSDYTDLVFPQYFAMYARNTPSGSVRIQFFTAIRFSDADESEKDKLSILFRRTRDFVPRWRSYGWI
jgi:hypothetical protein